MPQGHFFRALAGHQIVSNERWKPDGFQACLVQDGGKYANESDAEPQGVICSLIP